MKDLIHLQQIVQTIVKAVGLDLEIKATIYIEVWEDEYGALILAILEPPPMP